MEGSAQLLQVALADGGARSFAGSLEHREQQGGEYRKDRNHD
jgi:hypothetical protein